MSGVLGELFIAKVKLLTCGDLEKYFCHTHRISIIVYEEGYIAVNSVTKSTPGALG